MTLSEYSQSLPPAIEAELKAVVSDANIVEDPSLHSMLTYHLGWTGPGAGLKAQGKRIRPLLLLLTNIANDGEWQLALPAAASIELIHNFSLIHDDIEDKSEHRRGRETLWKIHQVPLALNAGDAMFSLAFIALERLSPDLGQEVIQKTHTLLAQTCLALTKGQHLDISFESTEHVTVEQYLQMIQGKTAALLATSTQLGALLAGADQDSVEVYRELGFNLGIAFQIQDDYLGIWGDPVVTGKSAASDLIARKKSLPILYGLQQQGEFFQAWHQEEISESNAPDLAKMLEKEGALDYTKHEAGKFTNRAMKVFQQKRVENSAVSALEELFDKLLKRSA
jgi:geranylgeranyl diphosphate synthase type I